MYVPSAGYCLAVVVAGLSASLVVLQLGPGGLACHKDVPVTTAVVIWS